MCTVFVDTEHDLKKLGKLIGAVVRGGECFELVGDVGSGKTTFTKGLGSGLRLDEDVQSPSFTISRVYVARDGLSLHHYDFYRLSEPGVMSYELAESLADSEAVTVIEWAETVADVLPTKRIQLHFSYLPDREGRQCVLQLPEQYNYIEEAIK